MQAFDPHAYGPRLGPLIDTDRCRPLGPGSADGAARAGLDALAVEKLVPGQSPRDADMARLCIAGAWLVHDWLEEAHRICQDVATASGSYWHGVMHRREPDGSNAKYWFRRVGEHAVFPALADAARVLAAEAESSPAAERLNSDRAWDPMLLIELCEAHRGTGSHAESLLRRVQQREWELLFDHCWREAFPEAGAPRH